MTTPSDHSKKPDPHAKPVDPHGHHDADVPHDPVEDSSIDLGQPVGGLDPLHPAVPASQSGISVVDWSSLVEDVPPPPAEPASFDAVSDVDILFPGAALPAAEATLHAHQEKVVPEAEATAHASAEELAYAQFQADETLHVSAEELMHSAEAAIPPAPEGLAHSAEATLHATPQELAHHVEEATLHVSPEELGISAEEAIFVEEEDEPTLFQSGHEAPAAVEAEAAVPEVYHQAFAVADTPPPISEMAIAEEAAFAFPEEMVEDKVFTPESMFVDTEAHAALPELPSAPKMELDSGRHLHDVVELGAESVVVGQSGADLSGVIPEVVDEDGALFAEVAAADSGVMAEVVDFADIAEEATVAEVDEDEVLELGDESVVSGSSVDLSEVAVEVVESDVSVPPAVPSSEIIVSEHDLTGDVMEAEVAEAGASGRDFIAEAVESGVDGTLALPGMELADSEVTIGSDSHKKLPHGREKEPTRVILTPEPLAETDDFYTPSESAVIAEDGDVILGGEVEEEVTVASNSSAIDLGSMPDMPVLPSASKAGDDVADMDLAALEQAASPSQRTAGKAHSHGDIDLGEPSGVAEVAPEVVDEAEIDFEALEHTASAHDGGSTVAFGDDVVMDPTADLEGTTSGVVMSDEEAVVDDEIVATEDEEEERRPRPPKVAKQKGRGGAWVGGTVLGTLVGAGACAGLILFGVVDEPVKSLRQKLGTEKTQTGPVNPGSKVDQGGKPSAEDLMARGDHKSAREAAETVEDNDKKNLLLGQIAFREYAEATARAAGNDGPKLNVEGAKTAIEKLEAAKTPDAYFQLGQIYELAGDMDKAKASYQAGLDKADAAGKKRFQAALDRLDLDKKAAALPARELDLRLALLTALVFAADDAAPQDEEAGYAFWRAVKAANEKKFSVALEGLKDAAAKHKKGRLLRLGKQQNPDSDPTEVIFLKCVEELTTYWALQEKYKDGIEKTIVDAAGRAAPKELIDKLIEQKIIAKAEDLSKGVGDLLKLREDLAKKLDVKDADKIDEAVAAFLKDKGGLEQLLEERKLLAEVAKAVDADKKLDEVKTRVAELVADGALLKKIGDKLKDDKIVEKVEKREDVEGGLNKLVTEWKTIPVLNDKLAKTEMDLKAANTFVEDVADALVKGKFLAKEDAKAAMVLQQTKKLIEMNAGDEAKVKIIRDNSDLTAKTAAQAKQLTDLEKRRVDELADQDKKHKTEVTDLNAAHKTAVEKLNTAHKDEVSGLTTELKARHTPAEMLSLWLPLLEIRDNKEFVKGAQSDAERVLAAADKKKEDEAKARALQGLALRNLGMFAEAEAKLKEAEKDLPKEEPWSGTVAQALLEVKDVVAFYGKAASDLAEHNYPDKAIQLLDRMLAAATPEQKGRLLAQRSLLRLEIAMAGGRTLEMTDDMVKQALADAKEAGEVAAAHYALGRIREELRDLDIALVEYSKAVDLHKANDAEGSRYKVAKARALIAPRTRRAAEPKPVEDEKKVGQLDREEADLLALEPAEEQRLALVLLTVLLQPAPPAAPLPDTTVAEDLADKILADPNSSWDAKAQALAIKGRYTEALRMYAEGLQKGQKMRAEYSSTLMKLINQHPRLAPRVNPTSNPLEGENHFGNGLRSYFAGEFAVAEKHLQAAVDAVDGDDENARYYYFLGLAQLGQGKKKDAVQNFTDGAALERRGLPSRTAVNASLERVQGPLRRTLDDERNRLPSP